MKMKKRKGEKEKRKKRHGQEWICSNEEHRQSSTSAELVPSWMYTEKNRKKTQSRAVSFSLKPQNAVGIKNTQTTPKTLMFNAAGIKGEGSRCIHAHMESETRRKKLLGGRRKEA